MEQIIQQYIQAKGLNEQQAQQLIQELQQLDEQQLQQVVANMQQQLSGNEELEQQANTEQAPQQMEEEMMVGQYGKSIITNNPKDPRLQGYEDSLKLYNSYEKLKSKLKQKGYKNLGKPSKSSEYRRLTDEQVIQEANRDKKNDDIIDNFFGKLYGKRPYLKASKEGNLYKTLDFYPAIINEDLGFQYFSDKIKSKSEEEWREHTNYGDSRLVKNYENVKPKQQVIYQPVKKRTEEHTNKNDKKSWINSYGHKKEKTGENSFRIYPKPLKKSIVKKPVNTQTYPKLPDNITPIQEEVYFETINLPQEEIYIQPTPKRRPRRHSESIRDYEDSFKNKPSTSGQHRYELNDDYVKRLHKEHVYGIKEAPKLIRTRYYESPKYQYGGIPVSMDGLYEYENTPVIVPNGNITMEGIDYPVDAYNADTGEFLETMYPDEDYNFDANNVLEIPKGKFGISKMKNGGKVKLKKNAEGFFIGNDGNKYGYDESRNQFYKINTFTKEIVPNEDIEVEDFNLTDAEKNKLLKNNLPEEIVKSRRSNSPNYFQPFNNIPLTSQLNFNSQGYESVDNKKQKPSTKKDEYSFVSDLSKMSEKSRKDNIAAYKSWTEEWNRVIPNFKSLPYPEQQKQALDWIKKNQSGLNYNNVIQQLNNWGYKDSPDKLLTDGMFAEGTNLMRPSNLIGKEDPPPLVEDVVFPNANTNQQSSVQEIPEVALPKEEGVDKSNDEVNMDDVVLGKLNNNDYSGRYLSNMKLRNNIIKLPYFGRTDLKIPGVYTQNISPYLNEIYSVNNAYKQNTDLNSAIGQAAQMQLGANTMDRINKISGSVYNNNQQQKVNWENSLAGIYNQQQQVDEQNRRNYDNDVNRTIANKQNIDNIIDRMAYEFKQTRIRNKNNMLLSQMLHPNYVITDDGTMIRKPSPFNKGYADYLQEQNEKLSKENEELKTRVAKYGIKRRKK